MNARKYISVIGVWSAAVLLSAGCSKGFLNKPALGALTTDQINNLAGVTAVLNGAYGALDGQGTNVTDLAGQTNALGCLAFQLDLRECGRW
jgi:hypothetical protein